MNLLAEKKKKWWDRQDDKQKALLVEHFFKFGGKVVRIEFTDKQKLWRVNQ